MDKKKYQQLGFTIIELLITISIAGALVAIAIPSFQSFVKDNCMTTGTNLLVTSLQQARSEAIKRKTNVTLTATGGSSNEWGAGWTITLDEDGNGNGTLDSWEDYNGNAATVSTPESNVLVRTVSLTCTTTTIDETGNDSTFVYGSDGFIDAAGTFDVCDDRAEETGRQISISTTGRPNTNSSYTGCS